jgi:hypothetical protein
MGFLGHWRCWWWCLLAIQKSFSLFQIVSYGMMDLAMEQSLLLLIRGLLLAISAISVISTITMVSVISSIDCVDLSILLLLL